MPKTLIKSRLHSNKQKHKIIREPEKTQSNSPPNSQFFKQELLSGNGFVEYKLCYSLKMRLDFHLLDNEQIDNSIIK